MIENEIISYLGENKSSFSFSEEGDNILMNLSSPLLGLKEILSLEEKTLDEDFEDFFKKEFRYTIDGIHWSEYLELNEFNLLNINSYLKRNHVFNITYKYTRIGNTTNKKIYLLGIDLNGNYEEVSTPQSYEKTSYKKHFPYLNINSINWTLNVLKKFFESGIVPKYISRNYNNNWEDEDYINLWWCIIYMKALNLNYNKIFTEILYRPDLLKDYLQQEGLYLGTKKDLAEMYYLANYMIDEVMRRGSISILNKERILPENYTNVSVQGELLRLIDYIDFDEFLFNKVDNSGWWLGITSPLHNDCQHYINLIKAYEDTKSFIDKDKYPLLGSPIIVNDTVCGENVDVLQFDSLGIQCGFDGSFDKAITISSNFNYEISFRIKKNGPELATLIFGVNGFDYSGNSIIFTKINDFNQKTNLFSSNISLYQDNLYYYISAVIFSINENQRESLMNTGEGSNLRFSNNNINKISPIILFESDGSMNISNFKIRMYSNTPQIYLENQKEIFLYINQRNPEYSDKQIKEIIERYLTPFDTKLQLIQYGN